MQIIWLKAISCSDNTLLTRVLSSVLLFLLLIRKTLCHAAQSVVEGRCPVWSGPDLTWTTSEVGAVVAHDRATASVPSLTEAPVPIRQRGRITSAPTSFEMPHAPKFRNWRRHSRSWGTQWAQLSMCWSRSWTRRGKPRRFHHCQLRLQRHRISSNARRNVWWIWRTNAKPKPRCCRTQRRGWLRWSSPIESQKPPPVPHLCLPLRGTRRWKRWKLDCLLSKKSGMRQSGPPHASAAQRPQTFLWCQCMCRRISTIGCAIAIWIFRKPYLLAMARVCQSWSRSCQRGLHRCPRWREPCRLDLAKR